MSAARNQRRRQQRRRERTVTVLGHLPATPSAPVLIAHVGADMNTMQRVATRAAAR